MLDLETPKGRFWPRKAAGGHCSNSLNDGHGICAARPMRKPMRFCGKDAVRTTIATTPTAVLVARNKALRRAETWLTDDRHGSAGPVRIVEFEPECDVGCERHAAQRRNPADFVAVGASGGSPAGRDSAVEARRRRGRRLRERALTIIIIDSMPGCAAYRDRVGSIMSSTGADHDHGDLGGRSHSCAGKFRSHPAKTMPRSRVQAFKPRRPSGCLAQ